MAVTSDLLTIGQLAERCGLATSALRFYEAKGLIKAERHAGGRRSFMRSTLRRVAFIQAGQRGGLSLEEVRKALALHRLRLPVAAKVPAVQPKRRGSHFRTGRSLPL